VQCAHYFQAISPIPMKTGARCQESLYVPKPSGLSVSSLRRLCTILDVHTNDIVVVYPKNVSGILVQDKLHTPNIQLRDLRIRLSERACVEPVAVVLKVPIVDFVSEVDVYVSAKALKIGREKLLTSTRVGNESWNVCEEKFVVPREREAHGVPLYRLSRSDPHHQS